MWLLIVFIAVPLIEIALFIKVGGAIGLWPTLAIVVLTAVVGTQLMRSQGAAAMGRIRRSFDEMRDPSEPLAHGAMILLAGALLLTPGFFTDACGFLLLVPAVRSAAFHWMLRNVRVQKFSTRTTPHHRPPEPRDDVIEGDFEEIPPRDDDNPRRPSGWTRH